MIRIALIVASCSLFTACMTAQDKQVWQESKDIMAVGPRQAIAAEKAPSAVEAPESKVSDASKDKDEKKVEKSVVR